MKAEYRFLRTHQGRTAFAKIGVEAEIAEDWNISVRIAPEDIELFAGAIVNGVAIAIRQQERVQDVRYQIVVTSLLHTISDTTLDAVECAAAVATWKSLGGTEDDAFITFENERWCVTFGVNPPRPDL